MRAVVQRAKDARVEVEGKIVGSIADGLLVLLGVAQTDTEEDLRYVTDKIAGLRIFEDEEGKLNKSVVDVGGAILLVSQFTLYGDARKGKRPSFIRAAKAEKANAMYEQAAEILRAQVPVETGEFQALMQVRFTNDGPVTILIDSERNF